MAKRSFTMPERRKEILKVVATTFHSSDDAAMEYLALIEGATLEGQRELFRTVLSLHFALHQTAHKCPPPNSIKPKEWKAIASRVGNTVTSWARCAIRNNDSLEETADKLWDNLTLYEGKDRVVALGILLADRMVPYAQMPRDIITLLATDAYIAAHNSIPEKIALCNRLFNCDDITVMELAGGITRILGEIESQEAKTALLAHFLYAVRAQKNQGGSGVRFLGIIGRTAPEEDEGEDESFGFDEED